MKDEIKKAVEKAVLDLKRAENWPEFAVPEIEVDCPKEEIFGDYTTNIAMILARILKENPIEIAQELAEKISHESIEKVEIVAPGYINFTLDKKYLEKKIEEINKLGKKYGNSESGRGEKVLVEFISANPTGPIHLGNGRGGPLGDTLARVLEKAGYKTEREYYINDWGHQIEILGHSVLKDEKAQYRGDYIDDLAQKREKSLQDPMEIGNWAAHEMVNKFIKPTCKKLGIHFDCWFHEEDLHKSGKADDVIRMLKEKELAYEKEGALWYKSAEFGDDKDRVLIKSDGQKSYIATDFAYHKDKLERGFSKLINIQGADHHKEAQVIKKFVEKVLDENIKMDYILTQIVKVIKDGQEIKMSKRAGVYFALDDLIEEVGADAVRFIFLSYTPQSHINFDINLAKEQSEKNPVYYVQYAHARISSIIRKAKDLHFKFEKGEAVSLSHEKELILARELNNFPEILEDITSDYSVHRLPIYAMKLADRFHSFYNSCKVLDEKNNERTRARLNLVNAVKIVLAETLELMGINAPERM